MCFRCKPLTLALKIDDLEPELKRVARLIWNGKLKPGQIDAKMVSKITDQLLKGMSSGYNAVDAISDAEQSFIKKMEANLWNFSGFKNHAQLKEANSLLSDGKGSYKSFSEFLTDVKAIDKTYNEIYLEAEYDHVIAASQSAASWQNYAKNGIRVVTFRTAGDNRVRPQHKVYDGLTLNMDDPFLDTHGTPLGFGCRCEWEPGDEDDVTAAEKWITEKKAAGEISPNEDEIKIPEMFRNNVGKTATIFPESHPYFDVDESTAASIKKQVTKIKKGGKNG